jgi:hypothetical protein
MFIEQISRSVERDEEKKLRNIKEKIGSAADLLIAGKNISYHLSDSTMKGEAHSVIGYQDMQNNILKIEIPQKGEYFPTMLHVLEAVVRTIAIANTLGRSQIPYPQLEFVKSLNRGNTFDTYSLELNVDFNSGVARNQVTEKNHIVFHKGARSQHINPEEIARWYYEWLQETTFSSTEQIGVLLHWPAHTVIQHVSDWRQPDDKQDVSIFHSREEENIEGFSAHNLGRLQRWAQLQPENFIESVVELE